MRRNGKLKIYGSGLISSHGECSRVIDGRCIVQNFDLEEVLRTPVKVDEMHQQLFAIDSFEQLYDAMQEAERQVLYEFHPT
jgi:phenylalanine-4-hydroxylase